MKPIVWALALVVGGMPLSFGQNSTESSATNTPRHHKKHQKKHRKAKVTGDTSGTDASIATHSTNTAPLKQ